MVPERAAEADQILSFWFEECRPWQWFRRSSAFDREVRCRFGELTQTAQKGGLIDWESDQPSALALVLLLDQFSRQIWRDQPQAYLGDARARRLSKQAIHQGWLQREPERTRRQFWLMPLLHAESPDCVESAIPLIERWVDEPTAQIARRNLQTLRSHGRYPWRDRALNR